MEDKKLDLLLAKYLSGEASTAEKAELADLLSVTTDEELDLVLQEQWQRLATTVLNDPHSADSLPVTELDPAHSKKVLQAITGRKKLRWLSSSIAAAACLIGFILFKKPVSLPPTDKPLARNYDRHIELPDHSIIVLKSGSTIEKISNRTIRLVGEAYFEITPDQAHPFIVYTGNVKTTVLGTSFDISAWDDHITVSVTSGKVQVENEHQVLATLTTNQQVSYNALNNDARQDQVDADKLVDSWAPKDLTFKGQDLQTIANILSKRYDVKISITDPELTTTQIVSSFDAAEPIDSILSIICTMNKNTHFTHVGDEIIISKH